MKPHTRLLKSSLPTACLLILAGVRVSAQVNLLPQGNFESPGVNTGWAEGFNIPNNQEFQVISENGKHWLRIENRDAGRQLDYVHGYVKVSPQIASLTISVRMKATDLKTGKDGWHTARVALMFEGGSFGYPPEVPELTADFDWVTKSVELKVPAGATRLNIQPAMFYCTGVFEIADLMVTPHMVAPTQLGDAVLPDGIAPDWDKTSVKTVNARRAQVSLERYLALHSRSRSGRGTSEARVGIYQGAGRLADSPGQALEFPGPRRRPAVGSLRWGVGDARLVPTPDVNPGAVAGPRHQLAL
jgi:hypothetical protein